MTQKVTSKRKQYKKTTKRKWHKTEQWKGDDTLRKWYEKIPK